MMKYVTRRPAPRLDRFVTNLWSLGDEPAHSRERIVPASTFELEANLDENESRVYGPDGTMRRHAGAAAPLPVVDTLMAAAASSVTQASRVPAK
jgi:hypothetical protein